MKRTLWYLLGCALGLASMVLHQPGPAGVIPLVVGAVVFPYALYHLLRMDCKEPRP